MKPLIDLIYKDTTQEQTKVAQLVIDYLKKVFTTRLVLIIDNPEKQKRVKIDSLDYAISAELKQKDNKGRQHLIIFFSRKITLAELRYDIYNKELLAIIKALREWRVYLEGAKYKVEVLLDHLNLRNFTITKELNRWQVY